MNNLSIRTRLLLGILLPVLLVYSVFAVYETRRGKAEAVRGTEIFLRELTSRFAAQTDGQFFASSQIPVGTADALSLDRLPEEKELYELLRRSLTSHPRIVGACIGFEPFAFHAETEFFAPYVCRSPDGKDLVASDVGIEYVNAGRVPYTEWPWFSKPRREEKGSWSEPFFDEGGGDVLMCTYSAPFFRNGNFSGVATIDVSLERIRQTFSDISSEGVSLWLFTAEGNCISYPDWAETAAVEATETAFRSGRLSKIRRDIEEDRIIASEDDGLSSRSDDDVWLTFAPLRTTGWSLMATIPKATVMAPVYRKLYLSVTVFVAVFCMIAGFITVATWRMTTPIRRLAEFAGELADGNLDAKVGLTRHSGSEIGRLVAAFDRMSVDLKSNIERRIKEESARKAVEGELRVARRIQASLLPRIFPPFPDRTEFELHAMNEPAAFIAGDFFDFFFLDQNTLGIVLADVSGHGVPAAMFMAVSRTAIRNNAVPGRSPAEIIDRVNTILGTDNDDSMFVTVFYGHYDVVEGTLCYVNAGHNPPYVLRQDGTRDTLRPTGPFLAAFEDAEFEENTVRLQCGETLFTFTDGVTEAYTIADDVLFGEPRLETLLDEIRNESVEEICGRVYRTVDEFSHGERHDDITLLVLKRNY